MPTTKRELLYEPYSSATDAHLARQKQLLLRMADSKKFTEGTRDLALTAATYVETVLTFRQLPADERRKLIRNDIAPWFGNWPPRA